MRQLVSCTEIVALIGKTQRDIFCFFRLNGCKCQQMFEHLSAQPTTNLLAFPFTYRVLPITFTYNTKLKPENKKRNKRQKLRISKQISFIRKIKYPNHNLLVIYLSPYLQSVIYKIT